MNEVLDDFDLDRNDLIIMGDMNIDYNSKNSLRKLHVKNFESRFNLKQLINTITRSTQLTATILDLIYVRSECVSRSGTLKS